MTPPRIDPRPVTPRERRMLAAVEHGVDIVLVAERFQKTVGAVQVAVWKTRKRLQAEREATLLRAIDAAGGRKATTQHEREFSLSSDNLRGNPPG